MAISANDVMYQPDQEDSAGFKNSPGKPRISQRNLYPYKLLDWSVRGTSVVQFPVSVDDRKILGKALFKLLMIESIRIICI